MNRSNIQRYEIIQNFVLPGEKFSADEPLYLNSSYTSAQYAKSNKTIYLQPGGWVLFDTFFNSLSVGFWKENCALEDLSFGILGSGRVILRFGLHRTGYSHEWLVDKEVSLDDKFEETIPLDFWPALSDGILYVRVYALEPSTITACTFKTQSPHVRNVKLGVCITHFNRQTFLLPAVDRIKAELLNDPESKKRFNLVIVDNSKNLQIEQSESITIIPNKNYGGSGGFARGLLHLADEGSFTHCLFMDDDASCEIESIRRTWQILAFSKDDTLAIAGSLLRANETFRLFEKGARFDGLCRPNKQWLDMRSVGDLLAAEEPMHIDYGGWWFFAFSISKANHYPFPFFVRGDDILFSLMNRFRIKTLNGIACWGEDFSAKHSPLTSYLDARYHVLVQMVILDRTFFETIKTVYLNLFLPQLFSYNYESAAAVTQAIYHVLQGPSFWPTNADLLEVRAELNLAWIKERMSPINADVRLDLQHPKHAKETGPNRLIRNITANGHFLPSFRRNSITIHQNKSFCGNFNDIFGADHVLYEDIPSRMGYKVTRNRKRCIKEFFNFIKASLKLKVDFDRIKLEYIGKISELTSSSFWKNIYNGERHYSN